MEISPFNQYEGFIRFMMDKRHIPLVKPTCEEEGKLLKACQNFEAIFIRQMLKEMRKTVPKDGIIPENNEQSLYISMFDEEIASKISKQGQMGLAETLFEQIRDRSNDKKTQFEGVEVNGKKYIKLNGNH